MLAKFFLFFTFVTLKSFIHSIQVEDISYYENLIKNEMQKAIDYQLPTDASEYRAANEIPIYYGTYDFVVIGAGSAGAVVASRLSEKKSWTVLLLEAGKPGNNFTDIPAARNYLMLNEYNWGFKTIPQNSCCLASNGICNYPRGKALGGSSTINGMVYVRGNKLDYDKWANQGNPGWYFKDVLPYFKKSEGSVIFGNNEYHSGNGYLNVDHQKPTDNKTIDFLKANEELGTPIADYNGENQFVTGLAQLTTVNGRRGSTEKAFLYPAKGRKNLDILTESYVIKIVTTKLFKRAIGVIFSHNNTKYVVTITKEIILSAGVFGSPQILMLSGIGPSEHLKKHNIKLVKNLEVGQNMYEHVSFPLFFTSSVSKPLVNLSTAIHEYLQGKGPLTETVDAFAFYKLYIKNFTIPDIESSFISTVNINTNEMETNGTDSRKMFQILLWLLHPKATGEVYLKSNNPYDYPIIDTNCFGDPNNEDFEDLLKAINETLKILHTTPLKKYNPQLILNKHCKQYPVNSKDYWICAVKRMAATSSNAVGTCRMGPNPNKGAVVNNRLKVHGIANLRVADSSIVPVSVSGHPHAASVMVGERAAAFIKEEHKYF